MTLSSESNACVVIPARYASSRFPGKPLIPLLGKPMILWVAEASAKAVGRNNVFVATDSQKIADITKEANFTPLLTSSAAITGTDRVFEAAKQIDYKIYVNVQGDEPLVNPQDIVKCISIKQRYPDSVINGFCPIGPKEIVNNPNIPKVVMTEEKKLIYMSRSLIPGTKQSDNHPPVYFKQVCIYGYNYSELSKFSGFGRKSRIEEYEDIEILRFLEFNQDVIMYNCSPGSLAVDVPSDVKLVENALNLSCNP